MALSACYSALKYIVVLISFIFWLVGLAVLGVAIWLLADSTAYLSMAQDPTNYYTGIYILLVAGALMFIIGFLGCCGAYRESPCLLIMFFCLLLLVVVAEVAAGVWFYTGGPEFKNILHKNIEGSIEKEYNVSDSRTAALDSIQKHLQCCGAQGPMDWHKARKRGSSKDIDLSIHASVSNFTLPRSCCKENIAPRQCDDAIHLSLGGPVSDRINRDGCSGKLYDLIISQKDYLWAGLAIIGLVQVLGLVLAILLCCAVRSVNHYKS